MNVFGGILAAVPAFILVVFIGMTLVNVLLGREQYSFDGDDIRDVCFVALAGAVLLATAKYIGA
jgi:hypothetical protein